MSAAALTLAILALLAAAYVYRYVKRLRTDLDEVRNKALAREQWEADFRRRVGE